jgi:hypothetical protein
MMEAMLRELVEVASRDEAVASRPIGNDMTMLVYPADGGEGMLVAVGYSGEHAHLAPAMQVVRKRSSDLQRCGAWLPAMFNDGGIYVTARLGFANGASDISDAELAAAQELLS